MRETDFQSSVVKRAVTSDSDAITRPLCSPHLRRETRELFLPLVDLPFRVFTGHIPAGAVASVLQQQIFWTIALVVFGRWLLSQGMRRVVVQGG